jgi:hypothetical protein
VWGRSRPGAARGIRVPRVVPGRSGVAATSHQADGNGDEKGEGRPNRVSHRNVSCCGP